MSTGPEYILVAVAVLLLLGVLASKASQRLGIPALLLFLALGMLAGSEGPGGIYFDDAHAAQRLGIVALAFILFAGGLDTSMTDIRPMLRSGVALSTLGVLLSALAIGWFATVALDFSWREGLLLGAVVSSTDAAAVFAVLRSRNVGLRKPLTPLLEFESASNDPMAVFLTLGMIRLVSDPALSPAALIPMFLQQMAVGGLLGYALGRTALVAINRLRLEYEGLYAVFTLSLVLLAYGLAAALGGNGFLAVYLAGLVLGNGSFIHKRSLIRFHDGLAWLMQIAMFLTLGLLVFPSRLVPVMGIGLVLSVYLIVVARPVSVMLSLALAKVSARDKLAVSWVGLRGAAPIILATFPMVADIGNAEMIFNLVFFIVLTSVVLQGPSIPVIARWLGVGAGPDERMRYPLEFEPVPGSGSELADLKVPHDSAAVGRRIVDLGLPRGTLVVLIHRGGEFIVASGGSEIQAGDSLLVLGPSDGIAAVRRLLAMQRPVES
ncbi:MAG: potassium/proton antiporter [Nitrospirae bacterium]|nr:potassium/proton antiporter [Nitrospirota bacterium]